MTDNNKVTVAYPDVAVQLTGGDGNGAYIIGRVSAELKRAGHRDAANAFVNDAMDCASYDELLRLVMRTVTVS